MLVRTAVAVAVLAWAAQGSELAIENGTVAPHQSATLGIKLAAGKEAPTGFQFDLEFDPAAMDLKVEAGPAAKQASKDLQLRELKPGKLHVLIIGFNRNAIPDGVLALIRVTDKGAKAGKSFPLRLTAPLGTNADAKAVAVTVKAGSVKVKK